VAASCLLNASDAAASDPHGIGSALNEGLRSGKPPSFGPAWPPPSRELVQADPTRARWGADAAYAASSDKLLWQVLSHTAERCASMQRHMPQVPPRMLHQELRGPQLMRLRAKDSLRSRRSTPQLSRPTRCFTLKYTCLVLQRCHMTPDPTIVMPSGVGQLLLLDMVSSLTQRQRDCHQAAGLPGLAQVSTKSFASHPNVVCNPVHPGRQQGLDIMLRRCTVRN